MLAFLATVAAKVGAFLAATGEVGCIVLFVVDEPECPKSLIK